MNKFAHEVQDWWEYHLTHEKHPLGIEWQAPTDIKLLHRHFEEWSGTKLGLAWFVRYLRPLIFGNLVPRKRLEKRWEMIDYADREVRRAKTITYWLLPSLKQCQKMVWGDD